MFFYLLYVMQAEIRINQQYSSVIWYCPNKMSMVWSLLPSSPSVSNSDWVTIYIYIYGTFNLVEWLLVFDIPSERWMRVCVNLMTPHQSSQFTRGCDPSSIYFGQSLRVDSSLIKFKAILFRIICSIFECRNAAHIIRYD